jgi:hypothetical protein
MFVEGEEAEEEEGEAAAPDEKVKGQIRAEVIMREVEQNQVKGEAGGDQGDGSQENDGRDGDGPAVGAEKDGAEGEECAGEEPRAVGGHTIPEDVVAAVASVGRSVGEQEEAAGEEVGQGEECDDEGGGDGGWGRVGGGLGLGKGVGHGEFIGWGIDAAALDCVFGPRKRGEALDLATAWAGRPCHRIYGSATVLLAAYKSVASRIADRVVFMGSPEKMALIAWAARRRFPGRSISVLLTW